MRKKPEVEIYTPREATYDASDMVFYPESDLSFLCFDSLRRYRDLFRLYQPSHPYNGLSDEAFCERLGFVVSIDGKHHLTKAGMLLFGFDYKVRRFFPFYALSYRNSEDVYALNVPDTVIETLSGTWSGTLFDFFMDATSSFASRSRLLRLDNSKQALMMQAFRELLSLALCNVDFEVDRGLEVQIDNKRVYVQFGGRPTELPFGQVAVNPTIANALACLNLAKRRGMGVPFVNKILKELGHSRLEIHQNQGCITFEIDKEKSINDQQIPNENAFEAFLLNKRKGDIFSRADIIKATGKSPAMASIYIKNALNENSISIAPGYRRGKYIKN